MKILKKTFILLAAMPLVFLYSCSDEDATGDYFEYTITGPGVSKTYTKTYETAEMWANYYDSESNTGSPAKHLFLAFPLQVLAGNCKVGVHASGPGTYSIPQVIDIFENNVVIDMVDGTQYVTLEASGATVTIETLEYHAAADAPTLIGQLTDGYANAKGSFQGTFLGNNNEVYQVTGKFRTGENF